MRLDKKSITGYIHTLELLANVIWRNKFSKLHNYEIYS